MPDPVRLALRVAELMQCSRADAEQYVRNGWVSVDGRVVEQPQHPVLGEQVSVADEARLAAVEPATLLFNKPAGLDSLEGPRPASALVTPATRWVEDPSDIRPLERHFQRLVPLVPLDREASGLMVFTQDGRVVRRLTEDADSIEHEFLVEVVGDLGPYGIARLKHGLQYRGRPLPPCQVSWQNECRLRFAIKGAREGQLRDMCAQVGLGVLSIRRLRIGRVGMGKGPGGAMPPGAWRYLPVGAKF